ncbi:MAG: UDP-N-acetylmuramoyl-L-alanine--D-glutamate ligase [Clostridia bacterium]|nr:UDP-N-acetylmuramoyl-L-alanine--D-glutamate ligase [Clostridia bacterium]
MDKEKFLNSLKGKKVTFCGIARTNMPVIELFLKYGAIVTARDKKTDLGENGEKLASLGVEMITGDNYLENITEDILFRAPGMPYYLPELNKARENGVAVTSEMEVFFDLCPCKIYAVTGSDGKTTTTSIIAEFLKKQGKKVHLGGNIGRPLLPDINEIAEDDVAVVELSSFQLISMRRSPDVAVVTNLSPNHLDVHKDMQEYVDAKKNIFLHQNAFTKTVLNLDNEITASFVPEVRGDLYLFSRKSEPKKGAYAKDGKVYVNGEYLMDTADISLPGNHNVENYLAAISAVWGDVSAENIVDVAKNFTGVAHRMEFVREIDGVKYYNDSIATSPSRAMSGTLSVYDEKIIIIAGGADKKIPFDELGEVICNKVKTLILVKPEHKLEGFKDPAADKIDAAVRNAKSYKEGNPEIIMCYNMQDAVNAAREKASKGDIVSLCPACTGFDMYASFEVRGNIYRDIIKSL